MISYVFLSSEKDYELSDDERQKLIDEKGGRLAYLRDILELEVINIECSGSTVDVNIRLIKRIGESNSYSLTSEGINSIEYVQIVDF